MDKRMVVHPHIGILFIEKKKWVIKPQKDMKELWKHDAKWKSQSENVIPTIWPSGNDKT